MFSTGVGVQEKVHKRRRREVKGKVLAQVIDEINAKNGTIAFVSRALTIRDYEFFIVLELNKFVYESHLILTQQAWEQGFKLTLSLLEAVIEIYLKEMANSFNEVSADESWNAETRTFDELLREAANSFM